MAGFNCWALLLLTMLPFIAVSGRPIPGTFLNSRLYLYCAIILKGSHISLHVVLLFRAAPQQVKGDKILSFSSS
jgi:hypothetical protein